MRISPAFVSLALVSLPAGADRPDTGEPVIVLELTEKDVLELELNSIERPTFVVQARIGGEPVNARFEVLGETFETRELLLQVYPCRQDGGEVLDDNEVVLVGCHPSIARLGEDRAVLVAPPRSILIDARAVAEGVTVARTIKLELNRRHFDLGWSGGYMVSDHRDERYRIVEDDDAGRSPLALDEASARRSFVAIGTLSFVRAPLLGLSFGVGTSSAELDEFAVLVGASFTFRMRRAVDAVILTVGGAFGPTLRLAPQFRGAQIPDEVDAADLLESEHELEPFLALSFRTSGDGGVRQRLGRR